MIEFYIDNKKEKVKIDKTDIVFQVYSRLFNNMSHLDIIVNITYLHTNGKINNIFKHVGEAPLVGPWH